MAKGFSKIRFHVEEKSDEELRAIGTERRVHRGIGRPRELNDRLVHFNNDETAARYYLDRVFEGDKRPKVRGLARRVSAKDESEMSPNMRLNSIQESRITKTRLVHFTQTKDKIPIFGSHVVVELDQNRELVDATGEVAEFSGISAIPAFSPQDALKEISTLTGTLLNLDTIDPPKLVFYHDETKGKWHLAYFFKKVSASPKNFARPSYHKNRGHKMGMTPRHLNPLLNYFVDAHNGNVLFYYSATPMIIPVLCKGINGNGKNCEFWGTRVNGKYELKDPVRFIETYDHQYKDVDNDPYPSQVVQNSESNWGNSNPAAISAHLNGTKIYNFFNSILMRDGVDDKGMTLVSVVNCTYSRDQPPPEWLNAWWDGTRMVYGQIKGSNDEFTSLATFLDIIAHELTHGITEYTAKLVYAKDSGALNESFSDIFGIIIKNWYLFGEDSNPDLWDWELGKGLGNGDLPLRDFSNPTRTNDPDHMDKYQDLPNTSYGDYGGVHINSNIHNKAVYNLLTAKDNGGKLVFKPREIAVLYYFALRDRLGPLANFSDALESILDIAKIYFSGDIDLAEKLNHIRNAYNKVGIT